MAMAQGAAELRRSRRPTGPAAQSQSTWRRRRARAASTGSATDVLRQFFHRVDAFLRADYHREGGDDPAVAGLALVLDHHLQQAGRRCRTCKRKAKRFEKLFWSGQSLDELYQQFASASNDHPLAAMFMAGLREWRRAFEGGAIPCAKAMIGGREGAHRQGDERHHPA